MCFQHNVHKLTLVNSYKIISAYGLVSDFRHHRTRIVYQYTVFIKGISHVVDGYGYIRVIQTVLGKILTIVFLNGGSYKSCTVIKYRRIRNGAVSVINRNIRTALTSLICFVVSCLYTLFATTNTSPVFSYSR